MTTVADRIIEHCRELGSLLPGRRGRALEFEEKMWTFERTRNEIENFVESMLFD